MHFLLRVTCYMLHDLYQHLPQYIDPVAFTIGSFSVRWYALSYIVGFTVVYLILLWRIKNNDTEKTAQIFNFLPDGISLRQKFSIFNKISNTKIQATKEAKHEKDKKLSVVSYQSSVIFDYLLMAFFSALAGGRIGYVLFYDAAYFFAHPLSIVYPYDQAGNFIGIYGMSYHGAVMGILMGTFIFVRIKKLDFLAWADFIVPAVPLGYFFGRVGNFLNNELYGRVTDSQLGMYFAAAPGQLRHPSQLYEALLEGVLLFIILWKMRNMNLQKGFLLGTYLLGYGLLRIFVEQFREPDLQLGIFLNHFTMGQLLSLCMVVGGLFLLVSKNKN